MRLFKRSPKYTWLIALLVILFLIGSVTHKYLQNYAEKQESMRIAYEDLIFMDEAVLSKNCGLFKRERFCPEYCLWDSGNKNQHCGIDLEAFSAARESYEDYLSYLLKKGSVSIKEIAENETPEQLNIIVGKNPENLKYINDESTLIEIIKNNPADIRYVKNPSETLQLVAVKANGCVVEYIKNPGKTILGEAVKNCPTALNFLKDLPDDIVKLALESYPEGITYLEDPDEELMSLTQKHGYFPDEYRELDQENIERFRELMKKLAPTLTEDQIHRVQQGNFRSPTPSMPEDPNEEEVRMAVKRDIGGISRAKEFFPDLEQEKEHLLKVINEPEAALAELEKPYDEIKLLELIFINPYLIKYLDQPSEDLQVFAVFIEPNVYQYIKNPARRIAMYNDLVWNCDRDYPGIADLPDDNEWVDAIIDFSPNMPKEEAVKILKDNGIHITDTGMYEYENDIKQIYASVQKNKADYLLCKLTSQSLQVRYLHPIF
ncbi:hypothetical protein JW752_03305 [Candidatus Peregrinibacteria bacterium]|nr:hypothetical protein [Candidatus Peregrinibacteria bacterium]